MTNTDVKEHPDLEEMESSLNELGDYLFQTKDRHRKLRWWSQGITAAIVIAIAVYMVLFYQTLSSNLTSEKFSKTIQTHITKVAPAITSALFDVMIEVSPIYLEAASKKAETFLPVFFDAVENQFDIFVTNMSQFSEEQFRARLEKIVANQVEEFHKAYPDLTDQQIERFIVETEKSIQATFLQSADHILNQSLPQIMEMQLVTEGLVSDDMPKQEIELSRLLLHKLLLLLDREIMEGSRYDTQ